MKFLKLFLTFCVAASLFSANLATASVEPGKQAEKAMHVKVKQTTGPVDINTADAKALATLKGIGAKKAQAIVDYRNEHGAFKSVDELANVKGIGKKRLEKIVKNNPDRIQLSN